VSMFDNAYRNDIVIQDILKKIPNEPHTVVYHGGPWHGKREPYDPQKREILVAEPLSPIYYGHPNDTVMTQPKLVRYTPKTFHRQWSYRHQQRVVAGRVAVGCTWWGRTIWEPYYETAIDNITFREKGIAMVAEGWKGEAIVEEKDCYGREIIDVDRLYRGNEYEDGSHLERKLV